MPSALLYPPFRTLPLAHPQRAAAERTFGVGRFRRIAWRPQGEIGACHATVARALIRDGGSPVLGWQIHIWPGLFIEALSHYVWQSPEGSLIDLTQKYPTDPARHTVFAPDPTQCRLACHSRYHVLSDAPEVQVLIAAGRRQAEHRRAIDEAVRVRYGQVTEAEQQILDDEAHRVAMAMAACLRLP